MNPKVILILLAMLLATPCLAPGECGVVASAQTSASKKKSASTSSKKSSVPAKKSSAPAKKSSAPAKKGSKRGYRTGSRKQAAAEGESSADVKRQQEATQREISDTKKQIQLNDASIKKGVDELGRLQGDIGESKERVKSTAAEVAGLSAKISGLETQVSSEEKQLQRLRTEYLKAIKKMRAAGKGNSRLAFIFSSSSFNQALRRMRYLKQFSEWKERRSAEIAGRVNHLKSQRDLLSKSLSAKDEALRRQRNAQNELEKQYARQDALVVELRANGEALNAHLAKKQAEANALRNRISSLIAAEEQQRRAREEERRAREAAEAQARREAEAREAQARREAEAREAQARREAEAAEARERAEAQAKEQTAAKEQTGKAAGNSSETVVAETKQASGQQKSVAAKKETKTDKAASRKQSSRRRKDKDKRNERKSVAAEKKQPERKSVEVAKVESGKSGDYASARRRTPRSETASKASAGKQPAAAAASGGGSFEKMRGSLPRPVSGSFRVTSPFGRHALPELPGVVYDNPGIDAQVAAGATAQAVYGGKVSGVYVIPGFSTVVIVNHGSYYTVYGNIASPSVKVGDNVKQGQGLGRLAVDEEDSGHSSIHFEVWRNREKLNPSDWIR